MYVKQSIGRPLGNPGVGLRVKDSVTLIDVDDILFYPKPDSKGVRILDNIVLKPGRYAVTLYMTPGTIEVTNPSDGDPDQVGFTPSLKFNHPGNSIELREFISNNINKNFIVVVGYCSGEPSDLIGTPCNPCKLTASYTGSKDSSSNEITLTQISKGDLIFAYQGTIPMEEPVAVVEAAATEVVFVSEGQYQLSAGSAAIASISGGSDGAVVTLLGVRGEAPTLSGADGKILLREGKQFTAAEGNQITLRAFDAGGDSLVWIEQSRFIAA